MKLPVFLVVLFLASVAAAAESGGPVKLHELSVRLDPPLHRLSGESVMTVRPGTERLLLALNSRSTIAAVAVDGSPVSYRFSGDHLDLSLPKREGERTVRIRYACDFTDATPQKFAGSEDPTYGITGVISPEGTFLGDGALWYPRGEIPPSRLVVTAAAPQGVEAVTAGRRIGHKSGGKGTSSTWEVKEPLPGISLSAGPYRIAERTVAGITVYTYLYPDNASLSGRYLDAVEKYLVFYQKLFGPYPFPKFAVVENFFPTGYGFPSYTLIGGAVLKLPFIATTSLPHEIAHNWWGNGVLVGEGGNWSEGLVTYLADYLLEARDAPDEGAGYRFRILAEYASVVTPDRDFPLREFDRRVDAPSRAVGYGKGAMLFHMVRTMIGDEAFYEGLRRVVATKLFTTATWGDFAAAFGTVSGTDVAAFMGPWLDQPGGPRLALADVACRADGRRGLISGAVTDTKPSFPAIVTLSADGSPATSLSLLLTGTKTPFSLTAAGRPQRLLLDPGYDLFRLLDRREVPPTVNRLKGAKNLTVVVTDGCRADGETLRGLLRTLGREEGRVVAEKELSPAALRRDDLLFCGVPKKGLPHLPKEVSLSSDGFAVGGDRFTKSDDALFLVLDDAEAPERSVSLFLPLSSAAAVKATPKITHYGKYTYLVFTGGENRLKGVLSSGEGGSAPLSCP